MNDFEKLTTESRLPESMHLDRLSAGEIAALINREDGKVAMAVHSQLGPIGQAIELIVSKTAQGGRLFYLGAGTSGRLGVLDAAECPPTFNTAPQQVIGIIAGGDTALRKSIEGAEDRPADAERDLAAFEFSASDVLVGIATSGRTPYVMGGLQYAQQVGAPTIGLACNDQNALADFCDVLICPVVGPEVVSGSTRMKAGTATKMVLNMLTTATMVRLGKTYGNLMVDLRASNQKLVERSMQIICQLTDIDREQARSILQQCDGELKTAVVMQLAQVGVQEARHRLANHQGRLRPALEQVAGENPGSGQS